MRECVIGQRDYFFSTFDIQRGIIYIYYICIPILIHYQRSRETFKLIIGGKLGNRNIKMRYIMALMNMRRPHLNCIGYHK